MDRDNFNTRTKLVFLAIFAVGYLLATGSLQNNGTVHAEEEGFDPPDIAIQRLDGASQKLSQYRGQWVLLNFWATWCGPCVEEMPSLESFYKKYKSENLVVLAVSVDRAPKNKIEAFVKEFNLTFQVFYDPNSEAANRFNVDSLPATFVLNPEGKVVAHAMGARNWMDPVIQDYFAEMMSFKRKS